MKSRSYKPRGRKASLEISITAVVVLIIAIVMLGLALGFIRNFFGGTVKQLEGITDTLDEQTRIELAASPNQITFLTSRIKVEGKDKSLFFAIRNVRQNEIEFDIDIDCFDAIGAESVRQTLINDPTTFVEFATFKTATIEGGKSDVLPLKVTMSSSAPTTIYKCKLVLTVKEEIGPDGSQIQNDDLSYARKLFEIEYKK